MVDLSMSVLTVPKFVILILLSLARGHAGQNLRAQFLAESFDVTRPPTLRVTRLTLVISRSLQVLWDSSPDFVASSTGNWSQHCNHWWDLATITFFQAESLDITRPPALRATNLTLVI